MIKHYAYLGYWVYCVLGEVYICDIDGNLLDTYPADDNTLHNFTDAKARINDHREGLILLHGIIPNFKSKEEEKNIFTSQAWQRVKDGNHKMVKGLVNHG